MGGRIAERRNSTERRFFATNTFKPSFRNELADRSLVGRVELR
jgi:hypothetical protein